MTGSLRIRDAILEDASRIADLLGQLGYPSAPEEVTTRLIRLRDFGAAVVRVAEIDGEVAGVVTSHVLPSIHAPSPVAWLTTLVVDGNVTGKGIGKALTASAEEWASGQGAVRIAVTSALHRDGAHAFYEHLGYARTGVRLAKPLPATRQ